MQHLQFAIIVIAVDPQALAGNEERYRDEKGIIIHNLSLFKMKTN